MEKFTSWILLAILVVLAVLTVRISQIYTVVEPLATSPVAGLVAQLGRT